MRKSCSIFVLLGMLFTLCGSLGQDASAASATKDPSFQAALQKWDQVCARAVAKFQKLSPEQADRLFFSDSSPLQGLKTSEELSALEGLMETTFNRWLESKETPDDRALFTLLEQRGLKPGETEGCPFLLVDDIFFQQAIRKSLSSDLLAYLSVREKQPQLFVSDGSFRHSIEEMGGWAVQWERFLTEQPRNAHRAEAREMYHLFMNYILMSSLDNMRAFSHTDKKMSEEWQDKLRTVVKQHPDTRTAGLIADFLKAIQADGFTLSKANKHRFQERIKMTFGPERKAAGKSVTEDSLIGNHGFRLQWVEGRRGNAAIKRTEQGLFIDAKQEVNGDFVTLRGTVRMVNPKELTFTGKIVTRVSHIAKGKVCPREGTFTFKTKGERKFWRLQEMQNPCDGVVDYIDIFF